MSIRHQLIRDLVLDIDKEKKMQVGNCPDDVKQWIEGLPLPLDLKRTFQWNWVNAEGAIGPYSIHALRYIMKDEWTSLHMLHRMFVIGVSYTGDPLVVKFTDDSCEVGLTNHETIASEDETPDRCYARISASLDCASDQIMRMKS
jgi:hypothetical protein